MGLIRGFLSFIIAVSLFLTGLGFGAYLFMDTKPRDVLRIDDCKDNCFSSKDFLGLLGSISVQKLGQFLPKVLIETEKTIAFEHPFPEADIHYVIVPKKDIKDVGDIESGDEAYVIDIFAVISELAKKEGLQKYKIVTNGPGYQTVGYLHFHLLGKSSDIVPL